MISAQHSSNAREIDSTSFSLGGDFDIRVLLWGREFDVATTCFGQKAVPRGGNLTFFKVPRGGEFDPGSVQLSNLLGLPATFAP